MGDFIVWLESLSLNDWTFSEDITQLLYLIFTSCTVKIAR